MDKQEFLKYLQTEKFTCEDTRKINEIFEISKRVQFVESVLYLLRIEDNVHYSRLKPSECSIEEIENYIKSTRVIKVDN